MQEYKPLSIIFKDTAGCDLVGEEVAEKFNYFLQFT